MPSSAFRISRSSVPEGEGHPGARDDVTDSPRTMQDVITARQHPLPVRGADVAPLKAVAFNEDPAPLHPGRTRRALSSAAAGPESWTDQAFAEGAATTLA